jgi:NAD+ kinase
MKTIGIISNNEKQKALEVAKDVYDRLISKKIDILLPEEDFFPKKYSLPSVPGNVFSSKSEIILSVGGDGTFLRAAKYSFDNETPILGINVGNLGFLTEIETANIAKTLDGLISGNYHMEKRMLLEGILFKQGRQVKDTGLPDLALNEFAITRSMSEKVIRMEIIVNDVSIKKLAADGIIIATPTGSTAYSLSAGGPVVEPQAESIIITPICPHTLFSRSIILGQDKELKVKLRSGNKRDILSIDGKSVALEDPSEYILRVTRAKKNLNLVSFNPNAFFKVFKEKFIERI